MCACSRCVRVCARARASNVQPARDTHVAAQSKLCDALRLRHSLAKGARVCLCCGCCVRHHVALGGAVRAFAVLNGYRGFYDGEWTPLLPDEVSHAHLRGGTILGSSRGGMDAPRIVDSLVKNGVNIVILIGGDGTHRGADLLHRTILARNLPITVACVPKTIDNDIGIIDRSFGFQTAVDEAVPAIQCAHTEALSAKNGIGLVKLMGREAGFIALYASLASRDVNMCLLPEAPWRMSNLLTWLEGRLERSAHAVIVVAEGAESLEQREAASGGTPFTPVSATPAAGGVAPTPAAGAPVARRTDESGNRILDDVGEHLKNAINAHFKSIGKVATLKYIDPSYIIRSSPANAADSELCARLAFNCVHGAMAGFSGFTVGTVDGVSVYLPTSVVANGKPQRVDILSRLYARLCSSTGQPSLE
ncbi:ATP-dependent 6-phosphofructokinase [archaeon]|nr:MAG: ATP-dependent 6-phosphofructokinase [archaeon]